MEDNGTKAGLCKNSDKVIDKKEKKAELGLLVAHRRGGGRWVAGEVVLVAVVGGRGKQQEAGTVCNSSSWLLASTSRGGFPTMVKGHGARAGHQTRMATERRELWRCWLTSDREG